MRKLILALILAASATAVAAQTGSKGLSQCLSDSTTGKDRKDLVRWILVSMIQHPAMADSITVTPAKIEEINKTTAQIFVRLMSVDCKVEFKDAYKTGGSKAIEAAFGTLGTVAVTEVMSDSQVSNAIDGLTKYMDLKQIKNALEDH